MTSYTKVSVLSLCTANFDDSKNYFTLDRSLSADHTAMKTAMQYFQILLFIVHSSRFCPVHLLLTVFT